MKIVRRLALPGAWLAGLLFAVHPLCVEAVAWISEQKSTLAGAFYLAAALAYLKFDDSRRRASYLAALALFLAALLAKTVTAVLPGVLLVVLWGRRGKLEWRRDLRPLVPWLAIGLSAGLFTAWVESALIGARGAEFALTAVDRVLLAARALWFYLFKILVPIDLTFFYPRWTIDATVWWQWLFPTALVAAWILLRRLRGALAASLIFTGTLFPALGFFNIYPFRYSYVADHFAYLAMLAVIVPIASVLSRYRASVLLPVVLALMTWQQTSIYRDEEALYRATIERNPAAWLAHNNLGNTLLSLNRRAEAITEIATALRLKPDFWEAHLSMGNALLGMPGQWNEAVVEYRTAVRLAPESERAHTNLGNALLAVGQIEEAIPQLQEALRIDPTNAEAHNDLGNAFSGMPGRLNDAIAQYRLALGAKPDFAEAHNNLGRALAQAQGRLPDAIREIQTAIRLKPDYAGAHGNLGNALALVPGRLPDAIAEYREAIRLAPGFAAAHYNLAMALARLPGGQQEAQKEFAIAQRLRSAR
ncbi:MAG TPA: tetratricopeptide repeat protein [Bryobacteraceae bacterium]|nr:tetratricopeptide repeat protein [Bryobacteraceae bacterium]